MITPLQTNPSSSLGPRFNDIDDIPDSESKTALMAEEDPDEAAEAKLALTVISLLFGLVVIMILVVALYFVARDCVRQISIRMFSEYFTFAYLKFS